jgi:hypothetical protein
MGHNRLTTAGTGFNAAGDAVGSVDYVVTGIADTFNTGVAGNDTYVRSVREAVHTANITAGDHEIWLPAWKFMLTLDRGNIYTDLLESGTDTSAMYGDLDIDETLTLLGIDGSNAKTSVAWHPEAAADAVFDLLGDYNGDGVTSQDDGEVGNLDWVIWRDTQDSTTDLRADGNDNRIVDAEDHAIWSAHWGDTLTLDDILVG